MGLPWGIQNTYNAQSNIAWLMLVKRELCRVMACCVMACIQYSKFRNTVMHCVRRTSVDEPGAALGLKEE